MIYDLRFKNKLKNNLDKNSFLKEVNSLIKSKDIYDSTRYDPMSNIKYRSGQALITLLFFMVIGITVTSAAIVVVMTNANAATINQQGTDAYYIAESGAEEGLLHLLRDPTYTNTETFSAGDGTATVTVANNTVTATGSAQNATRTLQIQVVYNSNGLSVVSRKEL